MTAGYLTFKGRDETAEGLDRKLSVHYYGRMRFIANLLPKLEAAANGPAPGNLSRVVSVLDPRVLSGEVKFSDLQLKHNFSLQNAAAHAGAMTDFYLESMAKKHPGTSFIHASPGAVKTGAARELPGIVQLAASVAFVLAKPFKMFVGLKESGERHLYAATAPAYAPSKEAGDDKAVGSDGKKGSGSYWLHWSGDPFPPSNYLDKIRKEGAEEKVVSHTEEVFKKICEEGGVYA